MKSCAFPNCNREFDSRGLCKIHAQQQRTTGRTWMIGSKIISADKTVAERIPLWKARSITNDRGCWLFQGSLTTAGYGSISVRNEKKRYLHTIVWEYFNGPVPEGKELDHVCRNRNCWNPDSQHLEPVTHLENVRRGAGHGRETHCPSKHPYDSKNTYIAKDGSRHCRACRRDGMRRKTGYYERHKVA